MDNFEGGGEAIIVAPFVIHYSHFLPRRRTLPPAEDDGRREQSSQMETCQKLFVLNKAGSEGAQKSTARGALFPRITLKVGRTTVVWEARNLDVHSLCIKRELCG